MNVKYLRNIRFINIDIDRSVIMKKIVSFVILMIFILHVSLRAQDAPKIPIHPAETDQGAAEQVIINGVVLSVQQISEMEEACGVKLLPGNNYKGAGSRGDNFWSTCFSAGNSNAQNTQGYVSVPGHGPVGYGLIGYSSGIILKGISITDSKFSPASRMSSSSAS